MLEPELELMEVLEFDPPREEPEVEAPLLLIEVLEGAAAMGADTLTVWVGTGRAIVTGWGAGSAFGNVEPALSNWDAGAPGPLCLAVAGEIRTASYIRNDSRRATERTRTRSGEAVEAVHLNQRPLLVCFVCKSKPIDERQSSDA